MKTLLLDLDGTMYHGTKIVKDGVDFVNSLVKNGIPFYFVTNNASRTKKQNLEHMLKMGYENIHAEQYFTSSMAAAGYAKNVLGAKTAFYVGADGLKEAIEEQGLTIVDEIPSDVVFVGMDKDGSYEKYSNALQYLLAGSTLIGTNDDRRLASSNGFDIGNGAIVRMFEYASGQQSPQIGKPHAFMVDEVLRKFNLRKEDCIMIGDNLETDIRFGVDNGIESILVLGGVHGVEDIEKVGVKPTKIVNNLSEIIKEIHILK